MEINVAKIPGLTKFNKMIHGISPRFFLSDNKDKKELNLNPITKSWNRDNLWKYFLRSLGACEQKLFFLNQVHGDKICCIDELDNSKVQEVLTGDAIISNIPNTSLAVFTADCLPIITYDTQLNIVGVVHAGRKGTSLRILSKTLRRMTEKYESNLKNIVIGFGPGIGGCCYEVDYECLEPFRHSFLSTEDFAFEKKYNKYMLNLKEANRSDALEEGILAENIFDCDICTICNNNLFFSYRKNDIGRTMTAAMLLP